MGKLNQNDLWSGRDKPLAAINALITDDNSAVHTSRQDYEAEQTTNQLLSKLLEESRLTNFLLKEAFQIDMDACDIVDEGEI